MKRLLILFLLLPQFLFSFPYDLEYVDSIYKDEELISLWNSIEDIYHPDIEDYLKIENYLKYGRRPYLDAIFDKALANGWLKTEYLDRSYNFCNRILQRLMLVGPNKEMPIFKKIALGGISETDLSKCIVMYVSHNTTRHPLFFSETTYSNKMLQIIQELQAEGYKGHVLFRIGGYPLCEKGGLRLSHVPYSFKVLSLIEASQLGYKNVLWLDCTVHPTNDLSSVFNIIQNKGYFLVKNGVNCDFDYNFGIIPDITLEYCQLKKSDLTTMPHICATIIGLSFEELICHSFIKEWYLLTSQVYPAMSFFPEEFLLSIAGWKLGSFDLKDIGHYMDVISQVRARPSKSKGKPFWFDKS